MTARLPLVLGSNGLPQQLQSGDTLPLASTSTFGVVKVDGTTVTESGGVLSASGGGVTPAALTKTNDTNVTITLGGSPSVALLAASSITLGWTGTLAVGRGGIGVGTLASNGVLYGNGTSAVQALGVNSTGTNKFLTNVSSGAPAWATIAAGDLPLATTGAFGAVKPDGTTVTISSGVISASGGGGGTSVETMLSFGTVLEAMAAVIPDAVTTLQVAGFGTPGDGGKGTYSRQTALPSFYVDSPYYPRDIYPPVPPSFVSGSPNPLWYTTFWTYRGDGGPVSALHNGYTSGPIVAGSLVILLIYNINGAPPASYTDSVGNVYLKAQASTGGGVATPAGIYYCANPIQAQAGVTFASVNAGGGQPYFYVFQVPGFTGATLDANAFVVATSAASVDGVNVTTPAFAGTAPALVVAMVSGGGNPINTTFGPITTQPAGWIDMTPPGVALPSDFVFQNPNILCDPAACTAVNATTGVNYHPTWTGFTYATTTIVVVFNNFNRTALNRSHWSFNAEWPVHLAAYGVLPGPFDNEIGYQRFSTWLASVSPPSDTSVDPVGLSTFNTTLAAASYVSGTGVITLTLTTPAAFGGVQSFSAGCMAILYGLTGSAGAFASLNGAWQALTVSGTAVTLQGPTGLGSMTISGGNFQVGGAAISSANPAVVTLSIPRAPPPVFNTFPQPLCNGRSLSLAPIDGASLPSAVNANQRYFVKYGTTRGPLYDATANPNPNSFQIVPVGIFGADGQQPIGKASSVAAINTNGESQSGVFSYTFYDDGWQEIEFDKGIYYAGNNQMPGIGYGRRKTRLIGHGARIKTSAYVVADNFDQNATGTDNNIYMAQFASTSVSSGQPQTAITLISSGDAPNFYPNSYVLLMQNDVQGNGGPQNPATFEYKQIKDVNTTTGVVTFYDPLRYNYNQHFPVFGPTDPSNAHGVYGPATIMQMSDLFDQEIEVVGLTLDGVDQEQWLGVWSLTVRDCEVFGTGFKTGPTPSLAYRMIYDKCRIHSAVTEVDKIIDHMEYRNCEFDWGAQLIMQSMSLNLMLIDGCGIPAGIGGTPGSLHIKNSRIGGNLQVGNTFGVPSRLLLENSNIQYITNYNEAGQATQVAAQTPAASPVLTFSGGTILIAPAPFTAGYWGTGWSAGASFTGTISGTTLTVSGVAGTIVGGSVLTINGPGVAPSTVIVSGSGTSWVVNNSQTVGPVLMTATHAGPNANGNPLPCAVPGGKVIVQATSLSTIGHMFIGGNFKCASVLAFNVARVYQDSSNNYCVDTDLLALPTVNVSFHATFGSGSTTITVTQFDSPTTDGVLLQGMSVTGTGIPAGAYIVTDRVAMGSTGTYTISAATTGASAGAPGNALTGSIRQFSDPVSAPNNATMGYLAHPCPKVTVINCTGGSWISDQSGAPPDIPMFSYFKRTFTGQPWDNGFPQAQLALWGFIDNWEVNVEKAYTGSDGTFVFNIEIFGFKATGAAAGELYPCVLTQVINCKTTGKRNFSFTAGSGVAGDTIAAVPFWVSGIVCDLNAGGGSDIPLQKMPKITMTASSDQGINAANVIVNSGTTFFTSGEDLVSDIVQGEVL